MPLVDLGMYNHGVVLLSQMNVACTLEADISFFYSTRCADLHQLVHLQGYPANPRRQRCKAA